MLQGGREGLVVATPERVSFAYEVAGLGSRFLAQLLDVLVFLGAGVVLGLALAGITAATRNTTLVAVLGIVLSLLLVFGYFPVLEGLTSGQTLGKRVARLRVVGDRGEPVTVAQVAIRNLVRIADFLPVGYGVGMVAIFAGSKGKRLGDYAAGTVVVRERQKVGLGDLVRMADNPGLAPVEVELPDDNYTRAARRVEGDLRRFILAYATRRYAVASWRRQQLADQVAQPLRALMPAETGYYGPLVVLDALADRVR